MPYLISRGIAQNADVRAWDATSLKRTVRSVSLVGDPLIGGWRQSVNHEASEGTGYVTDAAAVISLLIVDILKEKISAAFIGGEGRLEIAELYSGRRRPYSSDRAL